MMRLKQRLPSSSFNLCGNKSTKIKEKVPRQEQLGKCTTVVVGRIYTRRLSLGPFNQQSKMANWQSELECRILNVKRSRKSTVERFNWRFYSFPFLLSHATKKAKLIECVVYYIFAYSWPSAAGTIFHPLT